MASSIGAIDIERIKASQYVSAVGLVILLWDHVLTFSDEVRFVWKTRLSIPKVLFMFNRYVVPFTMIVVSHEFSGITPYLSIAVWYAIAVVVGMLSIATSNFLILLRLWVLWDRRPRLILGTLSFFVVTQLVALSLAGYVIHEMLPMLFFDSLLRICIPISKPKLVLLWSPGIAFELMVFLTTVWNTLDQPRSPTAKMARTMYRDGSAYFLVLFALRLVNLLLSIVTPASLSFLGIFFIWSTTNITLARLILNLRRESSRIGHEVECGEEFEDNADESAELPVLRRDFSQQCDLDPESKEVV